MEFIIEQGNHNDLDEIEKLYNDVCETLDKGINYPGWKKGIYPVREDAEEGLNNHELFVVRRNNKIIASIILNHESEKGYESVKWQCDVDNKFVLIIHTLVVHPNFAKMGVGAQLLNYAEDFGKENNIRAIRLDVYEKNLPAIKLYERSGYQYASTVDLGYSDYGLDWFKLYEKIIEYNK